MSELSGTGKAGRGKCIEEQREWGNRGGLDEIIVLLQTGVCGYLDAVFYTFRVAKAVITP